MGSSYSGKTYSTVSFLVDSGQIIIKYSQALIFLMITYCLKFVSYTVRGFWIKADWQQI